MRPVNENRVAIFLATSGHSGVDRIAKNLLPGIAAAGYAVDLLKIQDHGPYLSQVINDLQVIELKAHHVYSALPELIHYLRREHPTVLLTDKDRVNRSAVLACALSRVKTRLVVRNGTTVSINLANRRPLDRLLQRLSMRYLYRFAYAIIMPSQGAADDFAQTIGLPQQRISVVRNPVITPKMKSMAAQRPNHPWLQKKEAPVILGVGELSSRKDFATLLRAFAMIRGKRNCRLLILGRGKQRGRLLALASKLGVADDIDLPGFTDNPYSHMQAADVFVLCSRWEGLGIALVEALALGTPSVAADCPSGPREVLDNGRYGPLVPVGDHEALARGIESMLDHPPSPDLLLEAAQPYRLEASIAGYLQVLGLPANA